MITDSNQDPLGAAILDYYEGQSEAVVNVFSNIAADDFIPVSYFFRTEAEMPEWEQIALKHCRGKVLDIGAGAGSHSLALQEKGFEVLALDISPGAVNLMKKRGLKRVIHANIWDFSGEQFDTLLLLMNGIGLVGDVSGLERFLHLARDLLRPGGQILLDSSDIAYIFPHQEEAFYLLLHPEYYGIINYQMTYKEHKGKRFDWLYIDFPRLAYVCKSCSYKCERIFEGPHHEYLARLIPE